MSSSIEVHKPPMRAALPGTLIHRLRRHYIKPGQQLAGGIFLPEVGWNGGNALSGGCDAIYVGFTSTSGRILVGHELKTSRSDWLRELGSPGKADGWADECHEWWLVVSDPKIVKDGELPAGWGLMSPGSSVTRMTIHTKPDRKPSTHQPSWRAVRSIIARCDTLCRNAIREAERRAREEAGGEINARVQVELERRMVNAVDDRDRMTTANKRLNQLVDALGVRIKWDEGTGYYNTASLEEVRRVGEVLQQTRSIEQAVKQLTGGINQEALVRIQAKARDLLKTLDEVKPA